MTSSANWNSLPNELKLEILSYLDYPSLMNMLFLSWNDYHLVLNTPYQIDQLWFSQDWKVRGKGRNKNFYISMECQSRNTENIMIRMYFIESGNDTIFIKKQRHRRPGGRILDSDKREVVYKNCDFEQMAKKVLCNLVRRNGIDDLVIETNPKQDDPIFNIEIECDSLVLRMNNRHDIIRFLQKVELPLYMLYIEPSGYYDDVPLHPFPLEILDIEQLKQADYVELLAYDCPLDIDPWMSFMGRKLNMSSTSIDEDYVNQLLKRWQNNELPNMTHFQLWTRDRQLTLTKIVKGLPRRETCIFDDDFASLILHRRHSFEPYYFTIELSANDDDGKRAVVMFHKKPDPRYDDMESGEDTQYWLEFSLLTRNGQYTDFDADWLAC